MKNEVTNIELYEPTELDFIQAVEDYKSLDIELNMLLNFDYAIESISEENLKYKYFKPLVAPFGAIGYESVERGSILLKIWNGIKVGVIKTISATISLIIKAFKWLYRFITGKPTSLNAVRKKAIEVRRQTVIAPRNLPNEDKIKEKIGKNLIGIFILNGKIDMQGINVFFSILNSTTPNEYNNISTLFELDKAESFLERLLPTNILDLLGKDSKINVPTDLDDLIKMFYNLIVSGYYNSKTGITLIDRIIKDQIDSDKYQYRINFIELLLDKITIGVREYDADRLRQVITDIMSKLGNDYITELKMNLPIIRDSLKYERMMLDKSKVKTDFKELVEPLKLEEVESIINMIEAQAKQLSVILRKSEKRLSRFNYFIEVSMKRGDELIGERGELYKSLLTILLQTEFKFILDSFAGIAKSIRNFNYYGLYDYLDYSLNRYITPEGDKS